MAETAADKAYAAALAEIERVRLAGEIQLRLLGDDYAALQQIPPEIDGIDDLSVIDLDGTQIGDLSPLSSVTTLHLLSFDRTQVRNLAPLANLTELQMLSAIGTQVDDLTPLTYLTALKSLYAEDTQVSDLTSLINLTELTSLYVGGTQVSNLAALADLRALKSLSITTTLVSDIAALSDLVNLEWLAMYQTQISNLAPLANLTKLRSLYLSQTEVSDLAPLKNLRELGNLGVGSSKVSDLRPIQDLPLKGDERLSGLSFAHTPATEKDPELARLSEIEDNATRTRETLAYLKTLPSWPEPYLPKAAPDVPPSEPLAAPPTPPEQDPALPLIWGERGFAFLASRVDTDPVTEAALDDLRALLEDLRRKGNRHDDLYRLACEVQDRAAGEISELNLVRLHLSYQKLRRLYQSRDKRSEAFDDETTGVLGSVLEILPAVTMADANVAELIKRQEDERNAGRTPEADAAQTRVLETVQESDAPFAPEVKDAATAILQPGHSDRLAATKPILSRNTAMVVLTFVALESTKSAVFGPVGNYVYEHSPQLLALARTLGDDAFLWAQMVLATFKSQFEISIGMAREASALGHLRLRRQSEKQRDLDKRPK